MLAARGYDEDPDDEDLDVDDFACAAGYLFGADCFTEFADNFDLTAIDALTTASSQDD